MTWRQFARAIQAERRRGERASARRQRENERALKALEREERELFKIEQKEQAAQEVARYEKYISQLASLHRQCGSPWSWIAFARAESPAPPQFVSRRESIAREAAAAYRPGLLTRLLGGHKKVIVSMTETIERARAEDIAEHSANVELHQAAHALWRMRQELAGAILARNSAAYPRAIEHAEPYDDLESLGSKITILELDADVIALNCVLSDKEVVPNEELRLSAGGKVTSKEMAAGRYWPLFQDFVCSSAIRLARETLALLPVQRVITSVGCFDVNSSTGHPEEVTYLSVHFTRPGLEALNLMAIDPSDAMRNFPHRMKFKKTAGFEPIEKITTNDQWVTTS